MDQFRTNLKSYLIFPVAAILLSVALVLVFSPDENSKYLAEVVDDRNVFGNTVYLFEDLDGNGYSDWVTAVNNPVGNCGVSIVLEPSKKASQWNFPGRLDFFTNDCLIIDDYDGNNIRELYLFSLAGDSLLLNCVRLSEDMESSTWSRFITRVGVFDGKTMSAIIPIRMADLDLNGKKELLFGVNSGFSKFPRNLYAFDIDRELLSVSPPNGFYLGDIFSGDINRDGLPEFLLKGYASDNISDTACRYHDRSCWMIVLDHRLGYVFEPVELPGTYSALFPFFLPDADPPGYSAVHIRSGQNTWENTGYRFDGSGASVNVTRLDGAGIKTQPGPVIVKKGQEWLAAFANDRNEFLLFDDRFDLKGKIPDAPERIHTISRFDLDGCGEDEIVILDDLGNKIYIYRSGLTHPVIMNIPLQEGDFTTMSVKRSPEGPALLSIASNSRQYMVSYRFNPLFYMRWVIYGGLFLTILFFTLLVRKITRAQMVKRINAEKKITELQMMIVRNQMDPHFTMNAINAVINAVNRLQTEEATENLVRFSRMYRSMVLYADKIERSISEELDFTRNYLELEKFRFRDRFEFNIDIGPGVVLEWLIPKMVIQTAVENAVKHGFIGIDIPGKLDIVARVGAGGLTLVIRDNGVGRARTLQEKTGSTGRGEAIMHQFLVLYNKIKGRRVVSETKDLYHDDGSPAGTSVTILIPEYKVNP